MNELIKKLLLEEKSDAEIAAAVLEAHKDEPVEAIKDAIIASKKLEEVTKALEASEKVAKEAKDAKDAATDEAKRIDVLLTEKLKSIKINSLGTQFATPKELKAFNPRSGKFDIITESVSEAYGTFNSMLSCLMCSDIQNAKAISLEIDQDNLAYQKEIASFQLKKLEDLNIKAANDPSVSDAAARGGYAIPTEVDMTILQLLYAESVMLANMNTDNIVYQSKIYPLMYGLTVADITDQDTAVTEVQPTFVNPTVDMKRAGLFTNISNTYMRQKGADLVRTFTGGTASAFASFLDLRLAVGSVTGNSDLVNGIAFDANTSTLAAIVLNNFDVDDFSTVLNSISENADGEVVMIGSRKVVDKLGLMENSAGNYVFPQYINGGSIAPLGTPLKKNAKIGSALDIDGGARTGGSDDLLLAFAKQYAIAGVSGETRIAFSEHWRFTNDVITMRAIKEYGSKVLSATGTGGIVAVAQELN